MQGQILRNFSQNPFGQTRPQRDETRMMSQKIENLSVLMSWLTAAVKDLECDQAPSMTEDFDFYDEVRRFEIGLITSALRLSGGSQVKAARMLKLKATTLNAKIKTLKLSTR